MKYSNFYKLKEPEGPDYYDVEDFNFNTEIIDKELNRLAGSVGGGAIEHTILIPSANWIVQSGIVYQTVTVPDASPNLTILMGIPMNVTVAEMNAIIAAKVNATTIVGENVTLQAYSGTTPSIDFSLSFVILPSGSAVTG